LNSLRVKMHKWRGVQIGKEVFIDKQCSIDNAYPEYVYIGDNVCINMGCVIVAHTAPSPHFEGVIRSLVSPVVIHDYTLIGINATILPGVIIGRSAIVAAGSVVEHDVPEYTIVQGNPVKTKINFERFLVNKK
jgi:acetyltransferase-like isoleucine patch superfamily enzyme